MKSFPVRLLGTVALALTVTAAFAVSAGAVPLTPSGRYVYWTDYSGSLMRVDAAGGAEETVVASAGNSPNGVTVDRETGRIYWAVRDNNQIRSIAADGSDEQTLNVGPALIDAPVGVAIDKRRGRIYWANSGGTGSPGWAALDGSGQGGTLNTGGVPLDGSQGVAIDGVSDRIFWTNTGPVPETVGWAKLDGSGDAGYLDGASPGGTPVGMAFVPTLQTVFWAYYQPVGSDMVFGVPAAGGADTPLDVTGMSVTEAGGIGYDGATGRLLVADYAGNRIGYAAADGSGGGTLVSTASAPWGSPAATGAGALTSANAPLTINGVVGTSTNGTLKIQNTGNYPIQLLGTTSSSSQLTPGAGCPGDLTIGESCELTITFAATGTDTVSGNIEIATDAGKFSFVVKGTGTPAAPTGPKLTDVRAVKRCAEETAAGTLSVGFVSATEAKLDVTLQRSSTQRRTLPTACPKRAGQTDFVSKLIGKQSKKSFTALAGKQSSTLKQMFGTKKLSPGRYRMLFNYKNATGETVRKGTWFWVLDN